VRFFVHRFTQQGSKAHRRNRYPKQQEFFEQPSRHTGQLRVVIKQKKGGLKADLHQATV
jgi:hypothetical protein